MLFEEIFGFESQNPAPIRKTPELPMDSSLFDYSLVRSGAADEMCKQIEDADFVSQILGDRENVSQPPATPAFTLDFAKLLRQADARITVATRSAPKRQHAIAAIVEHARRAAPVEIREDDGWGYLAQSCERFVSQALIEA